VERLVVISSPALADGFRLAGVATSIARPGQDAERELDRILRASGIGLALITSDLWTSLSEQVQSAAERRGRPIVLPIPAGAVTDVATRRQILGEMLQRAIGYRIELRAQDPHP
jgi:vacuolar-type H+-ATPase subunit F/Vma7